MSSDVAQKSAQCRDCDCEMITWTKSQKTGKFYLCQATMAKAGLVYPLPRRPHYQVCTKNKKTGGEGCYCCKALKKLHNH